MLSQAETSDAAVNFDTYRILQLHSAVSLLQHGFLVFINSDRSNAKITHSVLIFTAVSDAKSRRCTVSEILQVFVLMPPPLSP